jgi:hypothetical protein
MNVDQEIAALRRLSLAELRGRFARLFGEESRTNNRIWLIKRLAWRMQALAEGDLSERARQRAAELANDANLRLGAPRPSRLAGASRHGRPSSSPMSRAYAALRPGTVLGRSYKGQILQVTVLELGFQFEGVVYPSLSAVAKVITGSHCNGRHFFRLSSKGGAK